MSSIIGGKGEKTSKGPEVRSAQVRTPGNYERGEGVIAAKGGTGDGGTKHAGGFDESVQIRTPMRGGKSSGKPSFTK